MVFASNTTLNMKNQILRFFFLAAIAAMVGIFTNEAAAQDRNFDPAQFRQRQIDGYKESLNVKSEEDWKKIEVLIGQVLDAQRDARMGGNFGGGARGSRGGGGGGAGGGGGNRGATPVPEREALQKAIEDKAPADEIKSKLAKYRETRKAKETAYEKAQEDLRKALSPGQEASAVLAGLLK